MRKSKEQGFGIDRLHRINALRLAHPRKIENPRFNSAEICSSSAVVAALAPICVDKFQHATEAKATLAELKLVDSWKQDSFIEKGGWATFAGTESPNRNVAEACAKMLNELK